MIQPAKESKNRASSALAAAVQVAFCPSVERVDGLLEQGCGMRVCLTPQQRGLYRYTLTSWCPSLHVALSAPACCAQPPCWKDTLSHLPLPPAITLWMYTWTSGWMPPGAPRDKAHSLRGALVSCYERCGGGLAAGQDKSGERRFGGQSRFRANPAQCSHHGLMLDVLSRRWRMALPNPAEMRPRQARSPSPPEVCRVTR